MTVLAAIDRDREQRARMAEIAGLRNRYESLTPRERDVITVKAHRHPVMHKMKANTVVDLVGTFGRLGGLISGH